MTDRYMAEHNEDVDEDLKREAYYERKARYIGCKCGYPDWPGTCPCWRNCPLQQEDE